LQYRNRFLKHGQESDDSFCFSPQYRAKLDALTKPTERHQLRPVIDSVLPWDQVVLAHQRLEQGGTGQNCAEIYGRLDHLTALVARRIGV